jgi:hypothetical protein
MSGLEGTKLCWLDGWELADETETHRRDVFPRVSNDPIVSELKWSKLIVTSKLNWVGAERVLGISYSGAKISGVLDMLGKLAKTT